MMISRFFATAFPPWQQRRCGTAIIAVAAGLLASCAGGAPDRPTSQYIEESTGATITRVGEPLVLFSDDPAFGANVRDYIYVAPLAVNQSGRYSWWLWLGQWSTIDRAVSLGDVAEKDIVGYWLMADGEPMELDAGARVAAIPGVQRLPYAVPVAPARSIFLPLTRSQAARLGSARELAMRTETADRATRVWQRWDGDGSALRAFAEVTGAGAPAVDDTPPLPTTLHDP